MSKIIAQDMLDAFREDAMETLNRWGALCVESVRVSPQQTLEGMLRCAHNLKGNASLIGFDGLERAMHRIEDQLLQLAPRAGNRIEPEVLSALMGVERFLRDWIDKLVKVNTSHEPVDKSCIDALENLNKKSEIVGAVAESRRVEPRAEHRTEVTRSFTDGNELVRIPSNKLDTLIQYIGELTLAQAIVSRAKFENRLQAPEVKDAIALCDKIILSLKLAVLEIRMLPIIGTYKKLERAALDVSVRLNKPIHFITQGEAVSVDKAVLARVFDPLMHLVRNAIDHGIESATDRRAAGKPEAGTVRLSAMIEPTGLVLRLQDDGRGLDIEKIKARAVERGLIPAGKVITDNEAIEFVFHPNFSTADQVTEISGRGVGLDVVQKEINALGGSLVVQTNKGDGTTFIINVPTNLSLIDVMVFRAGGITYAVPVQDIGEILQSSEIHFESSAIYERMFRLREQVVPVDLLAKSLVPPQSATLHKSSTGSECVLVIHIQQEKYGFLVDEVLGQQQIFVRPARGYIGGLFGVTGATVLSTGEPVVIINIKEIAENNFVRLRKGKSLGEITF